MNVQVLFKELMEMRKIGLATVALLSMGLALSAQDRSTSSSASDRYLVSAKAGGVNFVEGAVAIERAAGRSGILLEGDQIEIGDRVVTDTDGRTEILLNPGSYVRLAANSAASFRTTSLDDLRLDLSRGSGIFEVFAANDFTVTVFTPKGKAVLVESGVYRIDVGTNGNAVISVTEGKALAGESATAVKEKRTATLEPGKVMIEKFDRGNLDAFAEWSKSRAKDLAETTASIKNRNVRNVLASSFLAGNWRLRDAFGLWVYDPFFRQYCFLPFGYGWSSPYGYGFYNGIYWYNLPQYISIPVYPPTRTKGTRRLGDVQAGGPPPYKAVEKTREPVRPRFDDGFSPSKSDSPRFQPMAPPPAVYIAPAGRTRTKPE